MKQPGGDGPDAAAEWIPAREALDRLRIVFGGDVQAKEAIADRLRDGLLRSHADKLVMETDGGSSCSGVRLQPHGGGAGGGRKEKAHAELLPALWLNSDDWEADRERWRWGPGDFEIARIRRGEPTREFKAYGVKFLASEISAMSGESLSAKKPTHGAGGAPKKEVEWAAFWLAVVDLARDGRLNETYFSTQKALREELLLAIDHGLSDESIKPRVQQIWGRFFK